MLFFQGARLRYDTEYRHRRHPPWARGELGNNRAGTCRIATGGMEAVRMK